METNIGIRQFVQLDVCALQNIINYRLKPTNLNNYASLRTLVLALGPKYQNK
jgi:hypothetical protein